MQKRSIKKQKIYIPKSQNKGHFLGWFWELCRKIHNFVFVKQAKKRGLSLDEMNLDKQQIEAVVACEDSQLVLASAGSGKTMSLLAKIEYIHNNLGVSPERILAISFTKKTVEELIGRCSVKGIEFRTFHALGNSILQEYQSERLARRRLISEDEIRVFLEQSLLESCQNDQFARKLNDYILFCLSMPSAPGDYGNLRQKIYLNRLFLRREILAEKKKQSFEKARKGGQAIKNIPIRNKEEELVANWLYINGLSYEYRKELPDLKQKADFVISGVCLDIFALDKNGNSLLGNNYQKEVARRRRGYKRAEVKHIELQSWE